MSAYESWVNEALAYAQENPTQRWGQAWFNYLHLSYPGLADEIRATNLDPFHNDGKMDAFHKFVKERLDGS